MGQKVHPLGFRVGITKNHQSQWFARFNKYKYAQSVLEDRMIRDTLSKLFPELLNPVLNAAVGKKRDEDISVTPRITQIKIERGLIPYEIGIQIHAENCELLKSAIDNLKVKRELIAKLQKTRRYLLNLKHKLKDLTINNSETESNLKSNSNLSTNTLVLRASDQRTPLLRSDGKPYRRNEEGEGYGARAEGGNGKLSPLLQSLKTKGSKIKAKFGKKKVIIKKPYKFRSKLSKQELKRQRLIKKRLKRRQTIRNRYRQLILKGLFLKKKGTKIFQTLSLKGASSRDLLKITSGKSILETGKPKFGSSLVRVSSQNNSETSTLQIKKNTFSSRIKKKFVTLFIQKMNKNFLSHLKSLLLTIAVSQPFESNILPLGYSKKWCSNRLNSLKNQPIYKLTRMIVVLEQKLLIKLESLRKEFIAFGSLSPQSSESFGYFQILNFLKNLKELVAKLKREQKLVALTLLRDSEEQSGLKTNSLISNLTDSVTKLKQEEGSRKSLSEMVVTKKLNQIDDECRKIKFIEYLKDIIKNHRTKNIYFYLATMADARKDLKKIKQFTKRHADFLFGLNLASLGTKQNYIDTNAEVRTENNLKDKITDRVNKVLEKTGKKLDYEKTLQDIFLEQIEKQRNMCLENLQLTPKISIKFYSVNKKTLEQKASIVAYSVVDALEKRKAFRKVIKDAKETLMRTPGVKGVKIQVGGRLNGAEIARTEWVRAGRVPLQTLRANLDYSYRTASTIYGIIGVKVWIFKGYAKLITK
jgi:ribosomal protein S3